MPHCCKSYVDVQIQRTAETQLGNVSLRLALSERQFAIVMQFRIDYKANIFSARRIGWKFPGPKRIQMLFYKDIWRGVQYVIKTAQYITKFYIYTLHNYIHLKVCFLAK